MDLICLLPSFRSARYWGEMSDSSFFSLLVINLWLLGTCVAVPSKHLCTESQAQPLQWQRHPHFSSSYSVLLPQCLQSLSTGSLFKTDNGLLCRSQCVTLFTTCRFQIPRICRPTQSRHSPHSYPACLIHSLHSIKEAMNSVNSHFLIPKWAR